MKTFLLDLIPKLQRYSEKLDNLTLLQNHHWILLDEVNNSRTIYIFRESNELLLSYNGKVEKAKWEYLGNNTLLIDRKEESLLFKHGFFDENILALKIDSKDEYAILVNESKFDDELNSAVKIANFLKVKYIDSKPKPKILSNNSKLLNKPGKIWKKRNVGGGVMHIEVDRSPFPSVIKKGQKVLLNGKTPPDGRYIIGFLQYIDVKNGVIIKRWGM